MSIRPSSTRDLVPSERRFTAAMQQLGFGRFEFLRIDSGEIALDPRPTAVSNVKFGAKSSIKTLPGEFELKAQVAEFFEYVRSVGAGEIRTLEIQHGLPFSMEIEHRAGAKGGNRG